MRSSLAHASVVSLARRNRLGDPDRLKTIIFLGDDQGRLKEVKGEAGVVATRAGWTMEAGLTLETPDLEAWWKPVSNGNEHGLSESKLQNP